MKNVVYEKPSMKIVELSAERPVAASDGPCMAQASHGHQLFYYDAPGDGWVIIKTDGTNCNGKATFSYYDNPEIEGSATDDQIATAIRNATASLNADKQAFTGAYLDPQPSWS